VCQQFSDNKNGPDEKEKLEWIELIKTWLDFKEIFILTIDSC
jgi:hypothetical protein